VRAAARIAGAAGFATVALLAVTPQASSLHRGLEATPQLPPADANVVLGSGVMPEGELNDN
jgi:hypothetical protein